MQTAKKATALIFSLLTIGLIIYFLVCNMTYSEGNRAGYLTKISKKGFVFKTIEGQLNLGGVGGDSEASILMNTQLWNFSVADEAVYERLQQYEGKKVSLHYKQKIKAFSWQGDTDYFVDDIELLNKQ
ncbi:MAG: hypothetical protein ACPG5B_15890 [Chitinophagales bacterium]